MCGILAAAGMTWNVPLVLATLAFVLFLAWKLRPAATTIGGSGKAAALREAKQRVEAAKTDEERALALCDARGTPRPRGSPGARARSGTTCGRCARAHTPPISSRGRRRGSSGDRVRSNRSCGGGSGRSRGRAAERLPRAPRSTSSPGCMAGRYETHHGRGRSRTRGRCSHRNRSGPPRPSESPAPSWHPIVL